MRPVVREADGATVRSVDLLLADAAMLAGGVAPRPAAILLAVAIGTALVTFVTSCPRRAWRAALVGACGFGVLASVRAPFPPGLGVAGASLALAAITSSIRTRFALPEPTPDPRDEVGDPRIEAAPARPVAPDEVLEPREMARYADAS